MTLGRGIILISEFISSPPTLAVYDVAHSLPLGGVGRDFPFTEDESQSYFSNVSDTSGENKNHILIEYVFNK